jgi:hypothetical protein
VESKPIIRFAQLLEQHLNNQIAKKFNKSTVNNETLHQMHASIKEQVDGVFKKSTHTVTQPGLDWLSNQFFKYMSLKTNEGKKVIGELVIFNEYNLADLPYSDIQLLRNLFNETQMGPELEDEYKRRSAA